MTKNEIQQLLMQSLKETVKDKDLEMPSESNPQIFGSGSIIDSLDLVGIIVQVEEAIQEKTGKKIEVVDESSVITENSPFETIETLSAYIHQKLQMA